MSAPSHPDEPAIAAEIKRLGELIARELSNIERSELRIRALRERVADQLRRRGNCPGCSHGAHYPKPCPATCPARGRKPERPCGCSVWICEDARCVQMRAYGLHLDRSGVSNGCFGTHERSP
jgi:hypothetical protein